MPSKTEKHTATAFVTNTYTLLSSKKKKKERKKERKQKERMVPAICSCFVFFLLQGFSFYLISSEIHSYPLFAIKCFQKD